jgi:serine/threonine protein phosphatase PrpC
MGSKIHFSSHGWRSEIGLLREGNEDSGLVSSNLIAVADGMGGYVGGEIASRSAIAALDDYLEVLNQPELDEDSLEDLLTSSLETIDRAIAMINEERPELVGMGTTLTSLSLFHENILLLHIGDSRAYRIRGNTITQLSADHTVVQELLNQGRITADEIASHPQRSFLTQVLMGKGNIDSILQAFPAVLDDIYLVCSDGLSGVIDDGKILAAFTGGLQEAVDSLIEATYKNGAPDNVTVIAVRIGSESAKINSRRIGAAQ